MCLLFYWHKEWSRSSNQNQLCCFCVYKTVFLNRDEIMWMLLLGLYDYLFWHTIVFPLWTPSRLSCMFHKLTIKHCWFCFAITVQAAIFQALLLYCLIIRLGWAHFFLSGTACLFLKIRNGFLQTSDKRLLLRGRAGAQPKWVSIVCLLVHVPVPDWLTWSWSNEVGEVWKSQPYSTVDQL